MLFGLKPADPTTIAGAILLLITAALVAAFPPAHRASLVDPMVALRASSNEKALGHRRRETRRIHGKEEVIERDNSFEVKACKRLLPAGAQLTSGALGVCTATSAFS
jgi:hypothetical protein